MTTTPKKPRVTTARALQPAGSEIADINTRARVREIADRIESGGQLDEMDRWLASGLLRRWANREPSTPKNPRGRPPTHVAGDVALLFACRRLHPECQSDEEAIGRVAMDLEMSEDTVRDILRRKSR